MWVCMCKFKLSTKRVFSKHGFNKSFENSLSQTPATSKGHNILAHLFFLCIHLYFDSFLSRELNNSRTLSMPFGFAVRETEMIRTIFLMSTLSRTEIYKKGWPTFCCRPAVPVQHTQLYSCCSRRQMTQCSNNRDTVCLHEEHLSCIWVTAETAQCKSIHTHWEAGTKYTIAGIRNSHFWGKGTWFTIWQVSSIKDLRKYMFSADVNLSIILMSDIAHLSQISFLIPLIQWQSRGIHLWSHSAKAADWSWKA